MQQVPPPPTFPEQDWADVSLSLNPFSSLPTGNAGVDGAGGGYGLSNSWRNKENDLEVAIEEAGSFLGQWDVEAEARKEGMGGRGDLSKKGVLAGGSKAARNPNE